MFSFSNFQSERVCFNPASTKLPTESPIVRNDIPDVFWNSIEPYCAEITDADIKMLEDQIEIFQNDCHQKGFYDFTFDWLIPHSRDKTDSLPEPVSPRLRFEKGIFKTNIFALGFKCRRWASTIHCDGQKKTSNPKSKRTVA